MDTDPNAAPPGDGSASQPAYDYSAPPPPPRLYNAEAPQPFTATNTEISTLQSFTLRIFIPLLTTSTNDVPAKFKRFIAALFLALRKVNHTILLYKFLHQDENPVDNASDIPQTEDAYAYFHGRQQVTRYGKKFSVGSSAFKSTISPGQLKQITRVWQALKEQGVYMDHTIIQASQHRVIGWFVFSHPTYTNHADATSDIKVRMNLPESDIELITGRIADGNGSYTNTLKLNVSLEQAQQVMDAIIPAFLSCPPEFHTSSTRNFQFVLSNRDGTISDDQLLSLIQRQNAYLAQTRTIDVKNCATLDTVLNINDVKNSFRTVAYHQTSSRTKQSLFTTIERGQYGTYRFLVHEDDQDEAIKWLDHQFDNLPEALGGDELCSTAFGGLGVPRRTKKIVTTKLATSYVTALSMHPNLHGFATPPRAPKRALITHGGGATSNPYKNGTPKKSPAPQSSKSSKPAPKKAPAQIIEDETPDSWEDRIMINQQQTQMPTPKMGKSKSYHPSQLSALLSKSKINDVKPTFFTYLQNSINTESLQQSNWKSRTQRFFK